MSRRAFFISGDHGAVVANDVSDFRYRACVHHLAVGAQTDARSHETAETQFLVDQGLVEFMIGGAAAVAMPGDFVRVPPGIVYACRNAGDSEAVVLMRTTSPKPMRRAVRVGYDHAA